MNDSSLFLLTQIALAQELASHSTRPFVYFQTISDDRSHVIYCGL